MRKYLPIRIKHSYYGKGWWWGRYLFFLRHFAIVPLWYEALNVRTEDGKFIGPYCGNSWTEYNKYCK